MRFKWIVLGAAVLAVSFYASLKAMDWLWPPSAEKPVLAKLPPLPPVSRNSEIIAPVIVPLITIRDTLERAAPRNIGGKAENPARQILSNADINWTVNRGALVANGAQNALTVSTPLEGKLTVLGSLSAGANDALGNALGSLLGSNAAKQIGGVSIKSLNASAAIHGTAAVTARPEILTDWHIDPHLAAQVNLGETNLSIGGVRVAVPAQVKPVIDRTVNEQVDQLQQRLRNDRALEQGARREWTKMCRSIPLPPVSAGAPPLFLEMKPVKAVAAQPQVDARNVTLMIGLQAETRITARETKPDCPFPATLQIVPPRDRGSVSVGVPIDLTFTEVSRIVEAQLKDKTFPDDGSGAVAVTVKAASVNAAGDRLLISLLVSAVEKKSWFGFGGEATIHIWGRPVLDQKNQVLRLADLELAVESDAAFGLLGAAARAAGPYLQRALEERATIDLKTLAASAQQKLAAVITDFRKTDNGLRVEAAVTGVRLGDIAFDSNTLRVVAEATGNISVTITALPDL
jgi:hypothetical protein